MPQSKCLLSSLDSFCYFLSCQKSEYPMWNNLGPCLEVAQNLYQTDFTPTYLAQQTAYEELEGFL